MKSYRDLEIYKLAHKGALKVHAMTLGLPAFELYEEGGQIRRSSKSIAANIVEGYSRQRYKSDYVRFLIIAHGSCNETIEHLEILKETGSLKDEALYRALWDHYDKLGRKLNKFIRSVEGS